MLEYLNIKKIRTPMQYMSSDPLVVCLMLHQPILKFIIYKCIRAISDTKKLTGARVCVSVGSSMAVSTTYSYLQF